MCQQQKQDSMKLKIVLRKIYFILVIILFFSCLHNTPKENILGNKSCLIIIDVQKGIFKLKQPVYNEQKLIKTLYSIITKARKENIKIIYTQHENNTFLKNGTQDWYILDEIQPTEKDIIVTKKHPSIYENTKLKNILEQEKITQLYIAGLISNGCIKDACMDSIKYNYKVYLIKDGHSTFYKNSDKIISSVNNELEKQNVILISSENLF